MRAAAVLRALGAVLISVLAAPCGSATYDEAALGELPADHLAPAFLQLDAAVAGPVPGTFNNVLSGTVGAAAGVTDRDYLWFNVPAGYRLVALRVGNQTRVGGNGGFIGLASGTTMPDPATAVTAEGLLGWKLYSTGDRNTDILDEMAVSGSGASGFGVPLDPGDYTLWIQELSPGSFAYRFNLVLAPVPEPSTWTLLALGLAALAWRGVRRFPTAAG